ncbi:MAG: hypothetical protein LBJ94_02550 [Puniceicoccales bacterium]|jgi:hypothetical protein|nr:hypothetical protein [Puniceicoccales bacterium]
MSNIFNECCGSSFIVGKHCTEAGRELAAATWMAVYEARTSPTGLPVEQVVESLKGYSSFLANKPSNIPPNSLDAHDVRKVANVLLLAKSGGESDIKPILCQKAVLSIEGRQTVVDVLAALVAKGQTGIVKEVLLYGGNSKYYPVGHTLYFSEQRERLMGDIIGKMSRGEQEELRNAVFCVADDDGDKFTTMQIFGTDSYRG